MILKKMTNSPRSDILKKEFLDECFVANFETGTLVWKVRPKHHFPTERGWKIANTQCVGRKANLLWWKSKNYQCERVAIGGVHIPVHHVIWTMFYGEAHDKSIYEIDHIDRNPLNNSVNNLRLASSSENRYNTSTKFSDKSSHWKGVCYDKKRNKWMLQIRLGDSKISGRFENEESAAYLYRVFSEEFHEEYSPSFLKDVCFPTSFDYRSVTPSIRRALEDLSVDVQESHRVLFDGLAIFPWKRLTKGTNTGVEGVTLVTPRNGSAIEKRKFVSVSATKGRKSFSVGKYGYEEAFRLACQWASGG